MAHLSTQLIQILDKFADSQTALRLPTLPLSNSNPQIGTSIDQAINSFKASAPTHWAGTPPTTLQDALDRIAAALDASGFKA